MNSRFIGALLVVTVCGLLLAWFGFGSDQSGSETADPEPSGPEEVSEPAPLPSPEQDSQGERGAPATAPAETEKPTPTEEAGVGGDQLAHHLQPHLDRGCIDLSLLQTRNLTPLEREDLRDWLDSEGHFNDQFIGGGGTVPQPFGDYETYDDAGLQAIAESGDAKAHLALGVRLMAEQDLEMARHHYRESVILGYTAPILWLGLLARANQDREGLSEAERAALEHENMIEDQAYLRVYDRLGGPLGEFLIGLPQSQDAEAREANPDVPLESDIPEIQARADEIYGELMSERQARGIPLSQPEDPPVAAAMKMDLRVYLAALERGLAQCN